MRQRSERTGSGEPALLLQPFATTPEFMGQLHVALRRRGHRTYKGPRVPNVFPVSVIGKTLVARLEAVADQTGERVHLIGHSLGGLWARYLAHRRPALARSVTTLGSPFWQDRAWIRLLPVISGWLDAAGGRQAVPEGIPFVAIVGRNDRIVAPQHARLDGYPYVELGVAHIAMPFHPAIHRTVDRLLRTHSASKH
ncbi:MAG: alpha/beta fold hydrolase [Deltaproteobacteria bacterium]|nr:alpha/beta fold hydrolase [Deltaproteobacteria bacterium]